MPAAVAWPTAAVVPWPSSSASHPTAHSPRSGDPGGAALNLNMHIHALVMDGVFVPDGAGSVRFCPVEPMGADDVASLLTTIERRIEKLLARRGVSDGREGFDAPDRYADEAPTLAGLAAASVRGVAALGARAGVPVRRWGDAIDRPDPPPLGRWHARQHGFDLHAAIRETTVILRILRHLGLPDEVPVMRPARDPPLPFDGDDDRPLSDD